MVLLELIFHSFYYWEGVVDFVRTEFFRVSTIRWVWWI